MALPYQTLKVSDHRKTSQRNITQRSEIQIVTSQAFPATSTTKTIVRALLANLQLNVENRS